MKRLADRFLALATGPIQVRELRATFRGWKFAVVFTGALVIALFVLWSTSFAGMAEHASSASVGQMTFVVLLTIQAALIGLLLPGFAGTSIVRERDQSTLELLSTTTIRPWEIIWGQLMASMGYVAVYLFATLPLMAFPFWFGGLAGWEPVLAYVGLFLFAALISMWAIYVSSTSTSLARATIMSYIFVFSISGPLIGAMVELIDRASHGRGALSEIIESFSGNALSIALNGSYVFFAPFIFLFIAAVNRLKPFGSNRSTPMRIYAALVLPASAALLLGNFRHYFFTTSTSDRLLFGYTWWIVTGVCAAALAFHTLEGPVEGKRLFKHLDRLSGLKWPLRFFSPGGHRAFVFTLAMAVLTCGVGGALLLRHLVWEADEPFQSWWLPLGTILAQVVFGAGFGLYLGSLRLPLALSRGLWVLGVVSIPVISVVWQFAAYDEFTEILHWNAPGYLCFPWVLFHSWYSTASPGAAVMPEVGGHTPAWVPFWIFHFGLGTVLAVAGWLGVARREQENRATFTPGTAA